jgi:hypothetical protein
MRAQQVLQPMHNPVCARQVPKILNVIAAGIAAVSGS